MTIERNYIDSNWIGDLGLIIVICAFCFASVGQSETKLLMRVAGSIVLILLVCKILYYHRKIKRIKNCIGNTPLQTPSKIDRKHFYDLGISVFSDAIAIDILYNNDIVHSLKMKDLEHVDDHSCIAIVHSTWENWNAQSAYIKKDKYYQLILESGGKSKSLVRIKEGFLTSAEDAINPLNFRDLADKLATTMKIKIKDCTACK